MAGVKETGDLRAGGEDELVQGDVGEPGEGGGEGRQERCKAPTVLAELNIVYMQSVR